MARARRTTAAAGAPVPPLDLSMFNRKERTPELLARMVANQRWAERDEDLEEILNENGARWEVRMVPITGINVEKTLENSARLTEPTNDQHLTDLAFSFASRVSRWAPFAGYADDDGSVVVGHAIHRLKLCIEAGVSVVRMYVITNPGEIDHVLIWHTVNIRPSLQQSDADNFILAKSDIRRKMREHGARNVTETEKQLVGIKYQIEWPRLSQGLKDDELQPLLTGRGQFDKYEGLPVETKEQIYSKLRVMGPTPVVALLDGIEENDLTTKEALAAIKSFVDGTTKGEITSDQHRTAMLALCAKNRADVERTTTRTADGVVVRTARRSRPRRLVDKVEDLVKFLEAEGIGQIRLSRWIAGVLNEARPEQAAMAEKVRSAVKRLIGYAQKIDTR